MPSLFALKFILYTIINIQIRKGKMVEINEKFCNKRRNKTRRRSKNFRVKKCITSNNCSNNKWQKSKISNVPDIHDIQVTLKILKYLGCEVSKKNDKIEINSKYT